MKVFPELTPSSHKGAISLALPWLSEHMHFHKLWLFLDLPQNCTYFTVQGTTDNSAVLVRSELVISDFVLPVYGGETGNRVPGLWTQTTGICRLHALHNRPHTRFHFSLFSLSTCNSSSTRPTFLNIFLEGRKKKTTQQNMYQNQAPIFHLDINL